MDNYTMYGTPGTCANESLYSTVLVYTNTGESCSTVPTQEKQKRKQPRTAQVPLWTALLSGITTCPAPWALNLGGRPGRL